MVSVYARHTSASQKGIAAFDIGIGGSGSEVVLLPNLAVGLAGYATFVSTGCATFVFPVSIPAGSRISARYQAKSSATLGYVTCALLGVMSGELGHGTVEAWGVDTSLSMPTILDGGAVANTKTSWVQLIASTARAVREVQVLLTNPDTDSVGGDQNEKAFNVDVAVGAAGSEQIIIPNLQASRGWSLSFSPDGPLRLPLAIPAGTRISARTSCSSTSTSPAEARQIGIAMWGCG